MGWRKRTVGGAVGYAVAGPAGAVLGATLAGGRGDRGYDMSDIPTGVHVEADWDDDDAGRRWSLRFLSEIPATAYAELHLITDAGEKLQGRVPFCDEQGFFAATAPIHKANSLLYVPFEAVCYESPKYISLEVTVWDAAPTTAVPVGKGTLDAALPKRSARPVVSIATAYLQPIVALPTRVMAAESLGDAIPSAHRPDGVDDLLSDVALCHYLSVESWEPHIETLAEFAPGVAAMSKSASVVHFLRHSPLSL